MHLLLILPRVEPNEIEVPQICPYEDCAGESLRHHQTVRKALRDTQYPAVDAERYQCLRCIAKTQVYETVQGQLRWHGGGAGTRVEAG
jgi:hypothetical protein